MRPLCTIFFLVVLNVAPMAAQLNLRFKPLLNGKELYPDSMYLKTVSGDSISIRVLKFYISGIALHDDKNETWTEMHSFHLLDIHKPSTLELVLGTPELSKARNLTFLLGIDSAINTAGAMGGDLDPVNGMYWTWQSGYINIKLEGWYYRKGNAPVEFQYHLGGYKFPYATTQEIKIEIPESHTIVIPIDVGGFLSSIDIASLNHLMTPGADAFRLSIAAARMLPENVK